MAAVFGTVDYGFESYDSKRKEKKPLKMGIRVVKNIGGKKRSRKKERKKRKKPLKMEIQVDKNIGEKNVVGKKREKKRKNH